MAKQYRQVKKRAPFRADNLLASENMEWSWFLNQGKKNRSIGRGEQRIFQTEQYVTNLSGLLRRPYLFVTQGSSLKIRALILHNGANKQENPT